MTSSCLSIMMFLVLLIFNLSLRNCPILPNNDINVYITLLDASTVFDRVQYVKLFYLRLKRKLCPLLLRFLIVVFTQTRAYIFNGVHLCQ